MKFTYAGRTTQLSLSIAPLRIFLAFFLIFYLSFAACIDLNNPATYGGAVVNVSNSYYINTDAALCTGTYSNPNGVTFIYVNASNIVFDCNGSTLQKTAANGQYAIQVQAGIQNSTVKNCVVSKGA